ncbi:MAG: hypothetical protein V1853_01880 [bacterium]
MNEGSAQRAICLVLGILSGFVVGFIWETSTRKIIHLAHRNGYHYHHSLFGLVAFLFIPKFWYDLNKALFIAGFGLGIIIQHTINEGFIFITKD